MTESKSSMKEFLLQKADLSEYLKEWCQIKYRENINPDAINGDAWLDKGTTYIWKVGVLAVIDANKCDWVQVLIGHQRSPDRPMEFIGKLNWQDGENDDIGRSLDRYLDLMRSMDTVFEGAANV